MRFGEFAEELRKRKKLTLRGFCLKSKYDPGNISKIERGVVKPPQDEALLRRYAIALGLKEKSPDWVQFMDLAAAEHKMMAVKNISDAEVLRKLPVLFRAIDREDLTEDDLDQLIDMVKKS